ncbi:sugar isomerase [Paenibacillus camerounensis]|uniref:sugar isomerase n=1 Tax=Paenibacillus camerounensis TaxID=1243663 RepID=UPI0005A79F6B|nr:sugar isomerase [Paenibacillus camerounensis]
MAKKSILNVLVGVLSQLIVIGLGFYIPRLVILTYGSEANGLITSVVQVITYLSLLEAGVGAASIQALYKHIGNNDKSKINEILTATSSYYRKTGWYYFIAVILISIGYPLVVSSGFSNLTVMAIVLLSGLGGAVNYYFQGKFRVLLLAEGKNYIEASVTALSTILNNVIRIVLMLNGFDIIVVQAVYFVITIVQIIVYQLYMRKHYNWINFKTTPDYQAISQKNSVLIHELSYLVFKNTDVVLLTLFTNLKVVSVYMMYNMIFGVVERVTFTIRDSFKFALGQKYNNNFPKFVKMFNLFESSYISLVFALLTITTILILPFMRLYTAGIEDTNYIDTLLPLLFAVVKLLFNARLSSDLVIDIVGHFRKTQWRSILETSINFVFSLILVFPFGAYGVLYATMIALTYRLIDIVWYTNSKLLKRNAWITYKKWIINLLVSVIIIAVTRQFDFMVTPHSYAMFIVDAAVLSVTLVPLFFIAGLWLSRSDNDMLQEMLNPLLAKFKIRKAGRQY